MSDSLSPLQLLVRSLPKYPLVRLQAWCRDDYPSLSSEGRPLVLLGELEGMPGHCVVATFDGNLTSGVHTDNLELIPDDEL